MTTYRYGWFSKNVSQVGINVTIHLPRLFHQMCCVVQIKKVTSLMRQTLAKIFPDLRVFIGKFC